MSKSGELGTLAPMALKGFPVTAGPEGRLFGVVDSMAMEHRRDEEDDPLERSELARRLRRMEWPPAPVEVKARVLERIVEQSRNGISRDGEDDSAGR